MPFSANLDFARSNKQRKLPVVLTRLEVKSILKNISPNYHLLASLQYGSRLRLMELIRLRVKDIDFNYNCIHVWDGKGGKHRIVTLAENLKSQLKLQISKVKGLLELDLKLDDSEAEKFLGFLFRDLTSN